MLQIGDKVVIMSAPGTFTIVAVDGEQITIESPAGLRKTVLARRRAAWKPPRRGPAGAEPVQTVLRT